MERENNLPLTTCGVNALSRLKNRGGIFSRAWQRLVKRRRARGYPIREDGQDRKEEESADEEEKGVGGDETEDTLDTPVPNFLTELLVTTSNLAR